jgi:hypothetical protein
MRTGQRVKYAGIWKPIIVDKARKASLLEWFRRDRDPARPFNIAGAMTYLHAFSPAPKITIETSDGPVHCDTTLRLLWVSVVPPPS